MTGSPRRLRDDPDFRWETGCDLADESFAVGGYDLAAMRGRVLAEVSPPSGGAPLKAASNSSRWWAGAAAGASVTLLVGAALLVATMGRPTVPAEVPPAVPVSGVPAPTESPAPVEPAMPVEPATQAEPPVTVEAASPQASSSSAARAEPTPAPAPPPVAGDPAGDEPVVPPPPDPAPPAGSDDAEVGAAAPATGGEPADDGQGAAPPPASGLRAELEAYDRATHALGDGDLPAARSGFEDYLERWPSGRLRDEAALGLLRTLVQLGDHEAVEQVAAGLQDRPSMAGRQSEILRMRAENLVWLDQCDKAMSIAARLSGRDAADVKRACRRR